MEVKEFAEKAYDWAEQDDNNRMVLLVTAEKKNKTEKGNVLATSITSNGKLGLMVEDLVDVMKDNEAYADLIQKAFIAYTIETQHPKIGIGIAVSRKEGEDE